MQHLADWCDAELHHVLSVIVDPNNFSLQSKSENYRFAYNFFNVYVFYGPKKYVVVHKALEMYFPHSKLYLDP